MGQGKEQEKAHAHGQRLFSAGSAALERFIQIIGNPGQIAGVFQQRKQREENGHRRKHNRDDPGKNPVKAKNQKAVKPVGGMQGKKQCAQVVLYMEENIGQQGGRRSGAGYGNPENDRQ